MEFTFSLFLVKSVDSIRGDVIGIVNGSLFVRMISAVQMEISSRRRVPAMVCWI